MVAETSIVLASSSMTVPTRPGCTPSGGVNCTATGAARPPTTTWPSCADHRAQARGESGVLLVAPAGVDERAHQPGQPAAAGSTPAPADERAERLRRRRRRRCTPSSEHLALVQDRVERAEAVDRAATRGSRRPARPASGALNWALAPGVAVQRSVEPNSPMKHSARSLGPGPVTVALTSSVGVVVGGVDQVVVDLRVVGEAVDVGAEVVAHDVGLRCRSPSRRPAHPDPHRRAVGRVGRPRRRRAPPTVRWPRRRRAGTRGRCPAVLVAHPHRDEPLDAVPLLPLREVPGDVLDDVERAVLVGGDVDVEPGGQVVAWRQRRRARRRAEDQAQRRRAARRAPPRRHTDASAPAHAACP